MFRNRRTSQKPNPKLIVKSQDTFGNAVASKTKQVANSAPKPVPDNSLRFSMVNDDLGLREPTTSDASDPQFASALNPTASPDMTSTSQPGVYQTTAPDRLGSAFPNPPSDLFPSVESGTMTPVSLSYQVMGSSALLAPVAPVAPNNSVVSDFNRYMRQQYMLSNPYQQSAFAPSSSAQGDSQYSTVDDPDRQVTKTINMQKDSSSLDALGNSLDQMDHSNMGTKFRFNATLQAPTAMIKHHKEIPVTYLNKGQVYTISVVDSTPPLMPTETLTYRTYIRASFEEKEQRSQPLACWQLWKEGRGVDDAQQRGGKLRAVEYVDSMDEDGRRRKNRQVQVETASFDGFCVTWTASQGTRLSECALPVRFNFLSTNFSHSKGVKAVPVRLCAKTEVVSPTGLNDKTELCFCKIKLFRDHGAGRKLSSDVAHVKKTIEKLKHQISQVEHSGGSFKKRKRIGSASSTASKLAKQRSNLSVDSQTDGWQEVSEDGPHTKLVMTQNMFSSTRPVSILDLQGDEEDDPDLYRVQLPDEKENSGSAESAQRRTSTTQSATDGSSVMTPNSQFSEDAADNAQQSGPVQIKRVNTNASEQSAGYIQAVDVDTTYRPPSQPPLQPVACLYIQFHRNDVVLDGYYRAVYLTERNVRNLTEKISQKLELEIDPNRTIPVFHINENGMKIIVDNDVVQALPDGQDIVAQISDVSTSDAAGGSDAAIQVTLKF